jgi:hypothetical protein
VSDDVNNANAGIKLDGGKTDMSLFSWIWLVGVGRVLTRGKRKYAAHNWRKGLAIARLLAGVMRHITLFLAGQDLDVNPNCKGCQSGDCEKHTGENHLDCASCGIMFAREMLVTRPDLDDRFKLDAQNLSLLIQAVENEKE